MKALVLSGGGSKGSFQTGAIKYLLGELNNKYEILCGVSVGAINCAFIAQFAHGQEKECADQLYHFWTNLNNESIYKRWFPFGRWHALWRSSFFDSSPLHNLVKSTVCLEKIRETGKMVSVGAVSLSSGKYTTFSQDHDAFIDAAIASASFPGMFSPIKIGDHYWTDGGVKEISPIKTAIDLGATEVDLVITSPEIRIKKFIENPSTVDVLQRSFDLSTDKIMANDIEKVVMYNKLAEAGFTDKRFVKLNIIRPSFNLIEDVLDFNPTKIMEMIMCGYNDTKNKYITNINA